MTKSHKTLLIILAVILITSLVAAMVIGRTVKLDKAPALSGSVAQSLYAGTGKSKIPRAGKDFNLKNIHYFQNNDWVVVSIVPTDGRSETGLAVLQKQSDIYKVVLGPGTAFDKTSLPGLPADVAAYLAQTGVIYESAN